MKYLFVVVVVLLTVVGCTTRYRPVSAPELINLTNFASNATLLKDHGDCTLIVQYKNGNEERFESKACGDGVVWVRAEAVTRQQLQQQRPTSPQPAQETSKPGEKKPEGQ